MLVLFRRGLAHRITPIDLVLYEFLCSEKRWLRQFLIVTRDLNLLTILEHFLEAIVIRSKLSQLLAQVFLDLMLRVTVLTGAFDFL